jgi:oxazoline/thiazoline dehydrogenase
LSAALVLLWREGVTAAAAGEGSFVVQGPGGQVSFPRVDPAFVEALRRFDPPGEDEDRLVEIVRGGGPGSLSRWCYLVERLSRRGLLCHSAQVNGTPLATLVAVSPAFLSRPAQLVSGRRYVLGRFAYLRRSGSEAVLESPLAHARVLLKDLRAAALAGALAGSATVEQLTAVPGSLSTDAITGVLTLLLRAGLLEEAGAEEDTALQTWEFHDLLFHARSRLGRSDAPFGGTYRLAGRLSPPPALKPAAGGEKRQLDRPDLARLERDDPPLAWVQERRSSVRTFDAERPITRRQLGEFLFRVARVKDCWEAEVGPDADPVRMDFASRPYPAGGGLYELEFYVAVNHCVELEAGLYYHDPSGHHLTRLCGRTSDLDSLLGDAAASAAVPEAELQILIILAARFARVAWKYESIAYSLILKHVGVVYQTMYLAATAMGLGACAVGCGDADRFARAAGTDYYAETSVGEFLLGSQRNGMSRPVPSLR